jgi:predicted AAA+ superfamily ATPase
LNLRKNYKKIFYKEGIDEIDFYIEDIDANIQVCYELNEINIERELKPLLKQE